MKIFERFRSDDYYPWLVLTVTSLGVFLVIINIGTLNVALPEVSRHFHADAFTSSWILLSYMLVNTILILIFGQISDIFGRTKLYLIGMTIFTISSFAIGFSPNAGILIMFRVIQAVGGAIVITNTTALITDVFPKAKLGTGLSINILIASSAQLLGPVLGGVVAATWGWQWVFWFNVPIGLVALVWGAFVLRRTPVARSQEKIDLWGGALVFVALGGLVIALSESSELGWGSGIVLGGIILFVIFTPLFIWHERRTAWPVLDLGLFKNRGFAMANVATFLNSFSRSAVVLLFALFFQFAYRLNAFEAGLRVLPVTVGMFLISPVAGMLTRRVSVRVLASSGIILSLIGLMLLFGVLEAEQSYPVLACGMLLIGMGTGLFMTPNTTVIMSSVPDNRRGVANGLRSMLN
ncbi:DHA2 family efflux MFS transporter permease subunit, partial [Paenibacillus sepulcri]|nr:DHA2 family efflux MFS transporter permease subunit [Paenibacillus sepulcri]